MLQCITAATAVAAALLAGCADTRERSCTSNADCASGLCRADGTCAPVDADGGAGPDGFVGDGDGGLLSCQPNHDGVIVRSEVLLAADRTATYRVALDADVSTAGQLQPSGDRLWDLSGQMSNDTDVLVELIDIGDEWYADQFPNATYATRLSETEDLLGVFQVTDGAVRLLGVVSPNAGLGRTELAYDPPIDILQIPLDVTSQWTSSSTVTGLAAGVTSFYSEDYDYQVDAVGDVNTPFGAFPVLRVRADLTRQIGAGFITVRTYAFVAECYGTVASIVSNEYEPDVEFDTAAEVRRLAP
jgi:hypothetical protein